MADVITEYKEYLGAKKQCETNLTKNETLLAEKMAKQQEHLQSVFTKYRVSSLEELKALRDKIISEASLTVSEIKKACAGVVQ
jgi:hypothetical protein